MKAGKYEIKIGQNSKGKTVFHLIDIEKKEELPGEYEYMTDAIIAGLLLENGWDINGIDAQ